MSTDGSPRERLHRDGHLTEISYGGVVVRGDQLLVIRPAGKRVTGLPKGGPNAGETPEATAVREVREETGINVSVREPLGDVRYWYRRGGRRVHKTVHFFLCDFVSGSTTDHDHEVDEARWIPLTQARNALSYSGERALIQALLSKLAPGR
jgi:8-oxo-dGTP pyrophosphatase MutT (NUDIX family)